MAKNRQVGKTDGRRIENFSAINTEKTKQGGHISARPSQTHIQFSDS
jgi:hypothetical protein